MYLNLLSEFTVFLASKDHTLNEILDHLVRTVLVPLKAEAVVLTQLNEENEVENVARSGIPLEITRRYAGVISLFDKYPTTDTLRFRRTTWINTLPDWGDDYPLLKDLPFTTGAKSFIVFPIEKSGTPVASLGLFSSAKISPDAEIEAFLKAVGGLFSMYMYRTKNKLLNELQGGETLNLSRLESASKELTERQQIILRLISEDRTNLAISELLGYSESTVRQETMKIFAKLQCDGRSEAAKIYKEMMAKSKEK